MKLADSSYPPDHSIFSGRPEFIKPISRPRPSTTVPPAPETKRPDSESWSIHRSRRKNDMTGIGKVQIEEFSPNHPFTHSIVSFGRAKQPEQLRKARQDVKAARVKQRKQDREK